MTIKEKLLHFLSENPETPFSGESLAKDFNVTRAAIWKAIKQLKSEGFLIEAKEGKGYIYSKNNDFINKDLIIHFSDNKNYQCLCFDQIDSTNRYAMAEIESLNTEDMIVANQQTAGKGRKGHTFYSPGNTGLYLSYIVKKENRLKDLNRYTMASAVAVCQAIKKVCNVSIQIKWINDLFYHEKKLGGILTQATFDVESEEVSALVIGIGINCKSQDYPKELEMIATSLDVEVNRNQLAGEIHNQLSYWINHPEEVLIEYKKSSLVLNRSIELLVDDQIKTGILTDITEKGEIILNHKESFSPSKAHIKSWN